MQYAHRIASPDVASVYPMHCHPDQNWQAWSDRCWRMQLSLPDIPAQHIIVPSFAMTPQSDDAYQFQFDLLTPQSIRLPAVPAQPPLSSPPTAAESAQSQRRVAASAQIDCWHSETALTEPTIMLTVHCPRPPERFLVTLTVRPIEIEPAHAPHVSTTAAVPGTYSQMEADAKIRARICSPTALSMALSGFPDAPDWPSTVQACYDPQTNAYGVWPLAIHWASMNGIIGAVEACSDWQGVIRSLRNGVPVVCSIRFERGALPSAPLPRTSGHLVLLYGIEGDDVLVKDPAAQNSDQVTLRYPADAFAAAWLQRRGAAYFFAPHHQPDVETGSTSGH